MSRQVGSLNCCFSYQSNLQCRDSLITISDQTSSPLPYFFSTHHARTLTTQPKLFVKLTLILITPQMTSPMNSETPSPVLLFFQSPFQPIAPSIHVEISTSASSHTYASPICSPISIYAPDVPSPITNDQLEYKLDEFITH